jgi:hypothetical protein
MKSKTVFGWTAFIVYIMVTAWFSRSYAIARIPLAFPVMLIVASAALVKFLGRTNSADNAEGN